MVIYGYVFSVLSPLTLEGPRDTPRELLWLDHLSTVYRVFLSFYCLSCMFGQGIARYARVVIVIYPCSFFRVLVGFNSVCDGLVFYEQIQELFCSLFLFFCI